MRKLVWIFIYQLLTIGCSSNSGNGNTDANTDPETDTDTDMHTDSETSFSDYCENGGYWSLMQSPSAADLSAVWGSSATDVWVTGKNGVIFHYDGGTWSVAEYGIMESLNHVMGMTPNNIWVGGSDSDGVEIYHYNDVEWVRLETGFAGKVQRLWATEPYSVWLMGKEIGDAGGLIRHHDGVEWMQIETDLKQAFGAWGPSDKTIFFVGERQDIADNSNYGQVELYQNGSTLPTFTMKNAVFKGIYGLSNEEIYIWGAYSNKESGATKGTILNGNGHDFELLDVDPESVINDLWGNNQDNLFAVGENGIVLQKDVEGWRSIDVGISSTLNSVWGASGREVFAVGNEGTILQYTCAPPEEPGTETYDCQTLLTENSAEFYGIWGASPSDLFISSTAGVWRVSDETNANLIWPKTEPGSQNGIWGDSTTNVFSVGNDTDAGIARVVHCNGNDCAKMSIDVPGVLWDVHGFSATDVYAVGYVSDVPGQFHALAVHYDGYTWQDLDVGIDALLKSVWGASPNDLYAVGWTNEGSGEVEYGRLLHYDGNEWTIAVDYCDTGLLGIHGSSPENIYAVGRRDAAPLINAFPFGTVMHFEGIAWMNTTLQDERGFDGVWVASENEVYFGASRWNTVESKMETEVLKFVNNEWGILTCDVQNPIEAMWGQEGGPLFAITREGSILKYPNPSY